MASAKMQKLSEKDLKKIKKIKKEMEELSNSNKVKYIQDMMENHKSIFANLNKTVGLPIKNLQLLSEGILSSEALKAAKQFSEIIKNFKPPTLTSYSPLSVDNYYDDIDLMEIDEDELIESKNSEDVDTKKDKIIYDVAQRTLIYDGQVIHHFTAGKFPRDILDMAFCGDSRWEIPLSEVRKRYNDDEIKDGIKNFKRVINGKIKDYEIPHKILDSFIIRKPSSYIILSKVFIKG